MNINNSRIIGHQLQLSKLRIMLQNNTLPHAFLFHGIEGIGKRLVAEWFIQSLFCIDDDKPCSSCGPCKQFLARSHPDVVIIEPNEKGTIPIGKADKREEGSIRWLIDRLARRSISGTFGIIIDGVEKISIEGQNALLKTIEEPQRGSHLILISSNKSKILETIHSRCHEMSFHPLKKDDIDTYFSNNNKVYNPIISNVSSGSIKIAELLSDESIFNEIVMFCTALKLFIYKEIDIVPSLGQLDKLLPAETLFTILITIYRNMLYYIFSESENRIAFYDEILIEDSETIRQLIKIFLALEKGILNNLNFKILFKSMVYNIEKIDQFDYYMINA